MNIVKVNLGLTRSPCCLEVLSQSNGILRRELGTGCSECMWRITSPAKIRVARLRMFSDAACTAEIDGHAIAGSEAGQDAP